MRKIVQRDNHVYLVPTVRIEDIRYRLKNKLCLVCMQQTRHRRLLCDACYVCYRYCSHKEHVVHITQYVAGYCLECKRIKKRVSKRISCAKCQNETRSVRENLCVDCRKAFFYCCRCSSVLPIALKGNTKITYCRSCWSMYVNTRRKKKRIEAMSTEEIDAVLLQLAALEQKIQEQKAHTQDTHIRMRLDVAERRIQERRECALDEKRKRQSRST